MEFKLTPKYSDLPKPYDRTVKRNIKGKEYEFTETVHQPFLAATKCGKVMVTHVRSDGRLTGFAVDEMPIGWCELPVHPHDT